MDWLGAWVGGLVAVSMSPAAAAMTAGGGMSHPAAPGATKSVVALPVAVPVAVPAAPVNFGTDIHPRSDHRPVIAIADISRAARARRDDGQSRQAFEKVAQRFVDSLGRAGGGCVLWLVYHGANLRAGLPGRHKVFPPSTPHPRRPRWGKPPMARAGEFHDGDGHMTKCVPPIHPRATR